MTPFVRSAINAVFPGPSMLRRMNHLSKQVSVLSDRVGSQVGGSAESQADTLYRAVFGASLDGSAESEAAKHPDAQTALRALLNSPRGRWHMRETVPLWPQDKWICTEFQGLRIWVNMRDAWLGWAALHDAWEEAEMGFVLAHLSEGGGFLDVGAAVSFYTLRAARHVGPAGKVYAFEPRHDTASMLRRSLADNGFADRCTVFEKGVGEKARTALIHHNEDTNHGFSHMTEAKAGDHDFGVEIVDLDSIKFDRGIEVMKMDVEGYEGKVLKGAQKFIREHRPVFIGELFPDALRQFGNTTAFDYVQQWNALGYEVRNFDDDVRGVVTPADVKNDADLPQIVNVVCLPR